MSCSKKACQRVPEERVPRSTYMEGVNRVRARVLNYHPTRSGWVLTVSFPKLRYATPNSISNALSLKKEVNVAPMGLDALNKVERRGAAKSASLLESASGVSPLRFASAWTGKAKSPKSGEGGTSNSSGSILSVDEREPIIPRLNEPIGSNST